MTVVVFYLIGFILFAIIQAFFINGIHEAFKGGILKDDVSGKITYQGQILYMIFHGFIEKYKYKYWSKCIWSCVKCQSSAWGAITFWPFVIYIWGFHFEEILIYMADVCVLVPLNWIVYKKL